MSSSLMPHAVCWQQDQALIWTMVITNGITAVSYFSICGTLVYLAGRTRQALRREWVYILAGFALFIVACGSTHLMEVVTTWAPWFWLDAGTNVLTAGLSGYVAVQLMRRAPELGFGINDYAARLANAQNEKAQMAESLLAARKLEEWNRMSAVVTHEIANPLAAIQNLMFLMEITPGASAEIVGMARQAAEEVRRIEVLARGTLGFFRQTAVKPEKVDLQASAESVRLLLEPLMRKRSMGLEVRSEGDTTVTAFPVETRQVLLNLVRNACEATEPKGGPVRVGMTGRPDAVEIEITDRGKGIDAALMQRLFQFGVTTKGERGNGLGLWVVKQLVDKHGGRIEFESTPGEGTRVRILWPREYGGVREGREGVTAVSA